MIVAVEPYKTTWLVNYISLMVFRIEDNGDLTRVATMDWDPKISDVITWAPESG